MREDVLRVADLYAGYVSGLPIVNGVSLVLGAGEILAVFGPNGAGKSTMVRAIAGVVRIFSGGVLCAGRELARLPSWQIARAGVAYVPQRANVFAEMTVTENLALGRRGRGGAASGVTFDELLTLFPDLARCGEVRVGALSGGQRQMVAIGRALLSGPRVLMLDEPSAGLAPKVTGMLFAALAQLKARVPILLVEQNVKAALTVADRALLLAQGRLLREAAPDALATDPALAAAFLGPQRS
jgi:branched-chain amino acid transport system ATP-binding protein